MKHARFLLLLGASLACSVHAQSFGDMLRGAAAQATRSLATATGEKAAAAITGQPASADPVPGAAAAILGAMLPGASSQVAAAAGCKPGRGATLVAGPRPDDYAPETLWPENGACPVGRFGDFQFERAKAAKTAFREASKVRCSDCEGGYGFDAWGGRELVKQGDYSVEFPKLLAALNLGQSVGWKGSRYQVTITATGAHAIGDVPCRQLHYALKDGASVAAEYDGMVCEYKRDYAVNASWNEVI